MALPNKDNYIPVKMIYVLQSPIKHDKTGKPLEGWYMQGVQFNAEGKGTTTSYRDKQFLVDKAGCKDITKKHWEEKAKEWEALVKALSAGKAEAEPEVKYGPIVGTVEEQKIEPKPKPTPTKKYVNKKKKG